MAILDRYRVLEAGSAAEVRHGSPLFTSASQTLAPIGAAAGFRMAINSLVLDGIRLSAVATTGHRISPQDAENATVLVPWLGLLQTDDGHRSIAVRQGSIALPRPGNRRTTVPGPYLGLVVQVPLARLSLRAAANPLDWWAPARDWPDEPGPAATLRRYLRYLVAELDADAEFAASRRAMRSAAMMLTDLMLDALSERQLAARPMAEAGARHVLRAEEAIRAKLGEDLSVAALAAELQVSTRALQLSFKRHRGAAPRDVIAALRLDAAHRRLTTAEPAETVTSIALDCGLHHFGRFAARYRARFGEPPSATLARTQRRR